MPRFAYDTYQDVRNNLAWYTILPLNVAGFVVYNCVLPATHQKAITTLTDLILSGTWFKGISGVVVFSLVAFLLVEIVKIHDRVYDKYFVRWRLRYDTDFILPRLLQPFLSEIDGKIFAEAEEHLYDFMEVLYYPFVGDRDLKIGKNLLVRFYERVTIYWMTQMNELVLIGTTGLVGVYWLLGPWVVTPADMASYSRRLLSVLLVVAISFALNRMWVRTSREAVREATAREIEAIITNHREDLRDQVRAVCQKYAIPNHV